MRRRTTILLAILSLASAALGWSLQTQAAEPYLLSVKAGSTLELGIVTDLSGPEFSWILSQDRKFVMAQRTPFFFARLPNPGRYTLDVNIADAAHTQTTYEVFDLLVTPPTGQPVLEPVTGSGEFTAALRTSPPTAADGTVRLALKGGVLTLDLQQSRGEIAQYAIDIDERVDSDGNGNPTDDADNRGSYGEHDATPLTLLILPSRLERRITLTVRDAIGQTAWTSIRVVLSGTAPPVNVSGNIALEQNGLTVRPFIPTELLGADESQFLFEWDFGDGSKSLVTRPEHTYQHSGTYGIGVAVRSLQSGQVALSAQRQVTVDALASSFVSSAGSSASSTSSAEPGGGVFAFPLWSVLKVLAIILGVILFAGALYLLLRRIRHQASGRLSTTFEKMENELFQKPATVGSLSAPPPPLTVNALPKNERKSKPSPRQEADVDELDTGHSEFKTADRDPATPVADTKGPVPSWLKSAPPPTPKPQPPVPKAAATQPKPVSEPPKPPSPSPLTSSAPVVHRPLPPLPPTPQPQAPTIPPSPPAPKLGPKRETPPPPPPPEPSSQQTLPKQPPLLSSRPSNASDSSDDLPTDDEILPDWLKPLSGMQDLHPTPAPSPTPPSPSPTQTPMPPENPSGDDKVIAVISADTLSSKQEPEPDDVPSS